MRVSLRHPRRVLVCWIAVLAALGLGLPWLKIDTTTDSVLNTHTESWSYYQESQSLFGGDQIVVVALPSKISFDKGMLEEVDRLSSQMESLEGVRRVDSLATVPVVRGHPDGTLFLDPALSIPVDSNEVRRNLEGDRTAPRSLVSDDGTVAALNILIEKDYADYGLIVGKAREAVSHTEAWISGVPVFRSTASIRTRSEILTFVPATVFAVGVLIAVAYRSAKMTVIALAVGAVGSWVVVSWMAILGAPLSLVTMLLPSIMLALGCAYSIHVLSATRSDVGTLDERLTRVALPVALSSLTTAIGFSAIGTIAIDEVRYVGGFGAIGAMTLGFASLTLAPAMIVISQPIVRPKPRSGAEINLRECIVKLATSHPRKLIIAWAVLLLVLLGGVSRLQIETDPTQWFPRGSEVRDSYDAIGHNLSGISPVNIVVESASGDPVTDPIPLRAIDALTQYLSLAPQVGKAISVRDPLRQIHGGFLDDASDPLPDSPRVAEQYLLLLESVDQISDLVTSDRSAANILLRVNDNGSAALLEIEKLANQWWAEHGPPGFSQRTTGIMYEFALAEDEIAYGQMRGLMLALAAIGVTMLLALRSFRLAVVSMVPNVVPTAMVFGVMGWFGVPLDAGTVVIGSLALGIAVDDTIHLVNDFHARVDAGGDTVSALSGAVGSVLHPVVLTTAAIALGFGLFGFSGFVLTRNVGLLLAGVTVMCLVADLFLLPALLMLASRRRGVS